MLKDLIVTVLLLLPLTLPCGLFFFVVARWSLQREGLIVQKMVRAGILCCSIMLIVGIVYGVLRFSGILVFATDTAVSYHWFFASYRDEGFKYMYGCGIPLWIIVAAVLSQRPRRPSKGVLETSCLP